MCKCITRGIVECQMHFYNQSKILKFWFPPSSVLAPVSTLGSDSLCTKIFASVKYSMVSTLTTC